MRGNDLLVGACDVMVTDSLTGNILMKMMSSYCTGGSYEAVGYGYGPGIGEGYDRLVMIVSRASGAPVLAKKSLILRAALPPKKRQPFRAAAMVVLPAPVGIGEANHAETQRSCATGSGPDRR